MPSRATMSTAWDGNVESTFTSVVLHSRARGDLPLQRGGALPDAGVPAATLVLSANDGRGVRSRAGPRSG